MLSVRGAMGIRGTPRCSQTGVPVRKSRFRVTPSADCNFGQPPGRIAGALHRLVEIDQGAAHWPALGREQECHRPCHLHGGRAGVEGQSDTVSLHGRLRSHGVPCRQPRSSWRPLWIIPETPHPRHSARLPGRIQSGSPGPSSIAHGHRGAEALPGPAARDAGSAIGNIAQAERSSSRDYSAVRLAPPRRILAAPS